MILFSSGSSSDLRLPFFKKCSLNHYLIDLAFIIVSAVVKVLDKTITRVSSGSNPS